MLPLVIVRSLKKLKGYFLHSVAKVLDELLRDPEVRKSIAKPGHFERQTALYSLPVTLCTFLAECLSEDHSCRTAVARAKMEGWLPETASPDTGAFCRARDGLSCDGLKAAAERLGAVLDARVQPGDLWQGRVVRVVDGTGITLPDTPENQEEFPQPNTQVAGCGFPLMYVVALMSLATGTAIRYVTSRLYVSEQVLFHRLHEFLQPGQVVLGDRAFGSFGAVAWLLGRGVDSVFRLTSRRKTDFRRGQWLGPGDHIVEWVRSSWPKWLDPSDALPETIRLREVRFCVTQRGFRSREITLVTTLLDWDAYPKAALMELYRRRWGMELWLRDVKITMGMDMLRTRTPDRVRAELAMFLLGYNAMRAILLDAATHHQRRLDRISFKSALMRCRLWSGRRCQGNHARADVKAYDDLLLDLSRDANPDRPDRIEPRVLKRRKKEYDLMNRPRRELRERLLRA